MRPEVPADEVSRQRLAAETFWHPAPRPTLAQCRPDFVAPGLAAVPAIVAAWAA